MIGFELDGEPVEADAELTLLDALRSLGRRSVKDGCSPQGQCGCCTVLVDGAPRVACVTPVRRISGRRVVTVEGLDGPTRRRFASAFVASGASQCGFCTPGIILRMVGLEGRRSLDDADAVRTALAAHLCRCTGWQTIIEAAGRAADETGAPDRGGGTGAGEPARDPVLVSWRATLEGGEPQRIGERQALGGGGFADDRAPRDALVGVPSAEGWAVDADLRAARRRAGRPPGRRSTVPLGHPLALPPGEWALSLRTTWVDPAYLETDASWARPGLQPATALANGGAFGGKATSPLPEAARGLADSQGRPVRALWSREDAVRYGPKRPPLAVGLAEDGTGVARVATTAGAVGLATWEERFRSVMPGVEVEWVPVAGPPVSADLRAAGWAEAQVLRGALAARGLSLDGEGPSVSVSTPDGARAEVSVRGPGPGEREQVSVTVSAGAVLDAVTLRSYVIGAVHQGLGWVWREGLSVSDEGETLDLTLRSLGILTARQMPAVEVIVCPDERWPVGAGDAVFAATAAAAWLADDLAPEWPTRRETAGAVAARR